MTVRFRRLLLWIFSIATLIIVALVSGYIGRNFTGSGQIPARSAFAGRLPSIPDGNMRRYQFFYTTNRANNDETFKGRGNQLGNGILRGTFEVRISPYLPIKPLGWFETKYMEWVNHYPLPSNQFLSRLRASVQTSPNKSLLIVVWGFRDWFQSAALKTAYTAYSLDINTPTLLFDWPGNAGQGPTGYAAARRNASQSAADLGRVLANVIHDTGAQNVWLIGSSLGCQLICDALAWLATQPDLMENKPKINHVVLSAPDVSAQIFNEKFSKIIQTLSHHLTAYVSSNDRALIMSHWLNRSRPLGLKSEASIPQKIAAISMSLKRRRNYWNCRPKEQEIFT